MKVFVKKYEFYEKTALAFGRCPYCNRHYKKKEPYFANDKFYKTGVISSKQA